MPTEDTQDIIEKFCHGIGQCDEHNQIQKKKIEEHIKRIQPKILSKNGLILSPWKEYFETPNHEGNNNQPIKKVVPMVNLNNLMLQIIPVSRIGFRYDVDVFVHDISF